MWRCGFSGLVRIIRIGWSYKLFHLKCWELLANSDYDKLGKGFIKIEYLWRVWMEAKQSLNAWANMRLLFLVRDFDPRIRQYILNIIFTWQKWLGALFSKSFRLSKAILCVVLSFLHSKKVTLTEVIAKTHYLFIFCKTSADHARAVVKPCKTKLAVFCFVFCHAATLVIGHLTAGAASIGYLLLGNELTVPRMNWDELELPKMHLNGRRGN